MSTEQKRKMFRVPVRGERLSLRDMFMAWWPALLVVAIGFAVAWQFVEPAPPHSVVMVTGAEDGAYFAFAKQYGALAALQDAFVKQCGAPASNSSGRRLVGCRSVADDAPGSSSPAAGVAVQIVLAFVMILAGTAAF